MPKIPEAKIESLRPALQELERFLQWFLIEGGLDVPQQPVVVTIQGSGKGHKVCGWFRKDGWSTREGELVHEIALTAEQLGRSPIEILETVAHESIHYVNTNMGITDTSTNGQHKKEFKERAELAGLQVAPRDPKVGYGVTDFTREMQELIESDFGINYDLFQLFRLIPEPKPKAPKQRKWSCECEPPINLRVGKKEIDVSCNVCGSDFTPEELDER